MKTKIILLFILVSLSATAQKLEKLWSSEGALKTPESVLYDSQLNFVFVSNMGAVRNEKNGDGFISILKLDGNVLLKKWITGLNDPKGMAAKYGKLFVADINELVVIDIATVSILNRFPIAEAKFLNDVTVTKKGIVFVSDTRDKRIYIYQNDSFKSWLHSDSLENVNGLWAEDGKLYAGNESIWEIDIASKKMIELLTGTGGVDGLEKTGEDSFIFSNWGGRIFVAKDTVITKILDTTEEKINSADIDFVPETNTVLVPTFFGDNVVAYKLIE